MTKEQLLELKKIKKTYGHASVSWIQYKFHVSFKEAQRIFEEFNA